MKLNIFSIVASLFMLLSFQVKAQKDKKNLFDVKVKGLGCPYCATGLEKTMKKLKGLKDFKIDIETGKMTFSYPSEKKLTKEEVHEQVKKAGYTPVEVITHNPKTMNEVSNKNQEIEFFVGGNCEMCKTRIEDASLAINGVIKADWDIESKILSLSFDTSKTSKLDIEKAIAKVGHDSKEVKSDDATYNELPECCKYDRVD